MSDHVQSATLSRTVHPANCGRKPRLDRPAGPPSAFELTVASIVSGGLDVAALCSIFGVVEEWLQDKLVKAGLPAPGNRVIRPTKPPNGWTIEQIRLLVILWPTNMFATAIAERVGRSPASIRYKAKWLGLPARDRARLTRTAPKILPGLLPIEWRPWNDADEIQLGEEHLRGVATISTALRQCRPIHQVECRVHVLELPNRAFMRNKLKMENDPAAPLLEPFRDKGWHYRKCAFSNNMFWTTRKGPRICKAAKKSKAYHDANAGIDESSGGGKGSAE